MEETPRKFGLRLKALRRQRRLTQERLAEMTDRSVDAISNLERGISLPSYETLRRLSVELDVPLEELSALVSSIEKPPSDRAILEAALFQAIKPLDNNSLQIVIEHAKILSRYLI